MSNTLTHTEVLQAPPEMFDGPAEPEQESRETRFIRVGGKLCETDIPEGINIFDSHKYMGPRDMPLLPWALDALEEGEYSLSWNERVRTNEFEGQLKPATRKIQVFQGEKGKVIDSLDGGQEKVYHYAKNLMLALGYVLSDKPEEDDYYWCSGTPTPETVQSAAKLLGVEIRFFSNFPNEIDGEPYLQSYADGCYPASKNNTTWYTHDIEDDHLTIVVLGGDKLRDALQIVASDALSINDSERVKDTAGRLDRFTECLRLATSENPRFESEAFNEENCMETLYTRGFELGLDAKTIEELLAECQKNAKIFGMTTKDLKPFDHKKISLETPEPDFV